MEKTQTVIHLTDETRKKIEQYLKDGETYITETELSKRKIESQRSEAIMHWLDQMMD